MRRTSFESPVSRSTALMFCARPLASSCIVVGIGPIAAVLATMYRTASTADRVGMNGMGRRLAMFAFVVAGVALLAAAVALLDYLGRDLVTNALAPIAAIPDEPPQPVSAGPST